MAQDYGTINISLTSMSSRIATLPQTLRSILDQSYGDLIINLYLSREGYLLDKGVPELTDEMLAVQKEAGDRLRISYVYNSGPYRKLLPFLRENWGLSKLVVTIDDDTIYPSDWLQGLLDAHSRYNCVIGYRGHQIKVSNEKINPYRSWMKTGVTQNPSPLILPTGKDGILYDTAYFPIGVLDLATAMKIAPTVDDLWFRWHLAYNGINAFLINTDYRSETFEETDYESSLYLNFNRGGGNDVAIAALEGHFSAQYGFGVPQLA